MIGNVAARPCKAFAGCKISPFLQQTNFFFKKKLFFYNMLFVNMLVLYFQEYVPISSESRPKFSEALYKDLIFGRKWV